MFKTPKVTSESWAKPIVWGVVSCLLATTVLGVAFALIIFWSSIPEARINVFSALLILLSSFYGAMRGAAQAGSHGLATGLLIGLLYFLILLGMANILNFTIMAGQTIQSLVLVLIAGALGGIYGIFRIS